jgi:hypothetical protein
VAALPRQHRERRPPAPSGTWKRGGGGGTIVPQAHSARGPWDHCPTMAPLSKGKMGLVQCPVTSSKEAPVRARGSKRHSPRGQGCWRSDCTSTLEAGLQSLAAPSAVSLPRGSRAGEGARPAALTTLSRAVGQKRVLLVRTRTDLGGSQGWAKSTFSRMLLRRSQGGCTGTPPPAAPPPAPGAAAVSGRRKRQRQGRRGNVKWSPKRSPPQAWS